MRNKIVFIVATQYDNVGDLLINKCLLDQLSLHGDVYIDSKNVPEEFKTLLLQGNSNVFELKAMTSYSFKSLSFVRLLFSNLGFTHIFRSPGPLGNGQNVTVFLKNLTIGLIFSFLKKRGVKSFLIGNDIHCKEMFDRLTVRYFAKNVSRILCRSDENVRSLKKLCVDQVGYIPDMCFGYQPTVSNHSNDRSIAISFRDLGDTSYDDKIKEIIRFIIDNKLYHSIVFFYQVGRDYEYNKNLFKEFKTAKNVTFKEECLEWSDLSFYSNLRFTLSNRLHVLLLGLVHDVVPIPFLNSSSKTEKIVQIFKTIGLSDLLEKASYDSEIRKILQDETDWMKVVREIKKVQFNTLQSEINSIFEDSPIQ